MRKSVSVERAIFKYYTDPSNINIGHFKYQSTRRDYTTHRNFVPIERPAASISNEQEQSGKGQSSRRQSYLPDDYDRSSDISRFDVLPTINSTPTGEYSFSPIYDSLTTSRRDFRSSQRLVCASDDDNVEMDERSSPTIEDELEPDLSREGSVHENFQNNSGSSLIDEPLTSSTTMFNKESHGIAVLQSRSDSPTTLIVGICSLCQSRSFRISIGTTIHNLIDIIWDQMNFYREGYTKDSHVLLLFNHRLHIFVSNDNNTLVKDFILLSPSPPPSHLSTNGLVDFYVYGLPLEHARHMYYFDDDCSSLFGNPKSWFPVHFTNYEQLERPQSVLLSSLYTLRLYFRPENQELRAQQVAMEAQFFIHLRKYLFPPAILALKHAVAGSMFWFEKSLLMDGLVQLLSRLCDTERVKPEEVCDFIPLLFCWLLEQCDPNEEEEGHFPEVKLIKTQTNAHGYFQNPVTTSETKRKVLLLEEFDDVQNCDVIKHVDVRSLILYLRSDTNLSSGCPCSWDSYIIYDPIIRDLPVLQSLERWSESDIQNLYTIIAQTQEYRSFCIVTRGVVTADIKNQLVLLEQNRTVALLFSQKKAMRPDAKTRDDIDHFFQLFDPLMCTKDKPYIHVQLDTFFDESKMEPRLPVYFQNSMDITTANINSSLYTEPTGPAHQVTVILLDRSRSMTDYRVTSSDKTTSIEHMNVCEMMISRLSDNVFTASEVHALGRIEFATKCKTVCPITRSREEFEKARSYYNGDKEWTCMNDAIGEAIRQIKTFTDSPRRARRNCKKLIICLSDGINNRGNTEIGKLRNLALGNKIVIDLISFIRDDQLKSEKEILYARQMRDLCIQSHGYVYRNIQLLSDIELTALFEQEAAAWLSKRSQTSYGLVDKPERDVPVMFKETAVQVSSIRDVPSSSVSRRVFSELRAIVKDQDLSESVAVFAVPSNIAFWKVILKGPDETSYQGKFWMVYVEFNSNYPKCSPDVRFITPIYHVNISGDGKICHQIFNQGWSQSAKMRTVFSNILDLLKKPNPDDAVSLEMAHLYNKNKKEYDKQAEIHSKKHAQNSIDALKREYQLEEDDNQQDGSNS